MTAFVPPFHFLCDLDKLSICLSLTFSSCLYQPVLYFMYKNILYHKLLKQLKASKILDFLSCSHPFSSLSFSIPAKFLVKGTKSFLSIKPFILSGIQAAEHSSGNLCNLTGWCTGNLWFAGSAGHSEKLSQPSPST